jgi:hypothetical protein
MKDLHSGYEVAKALAPSSTSDNTALVGSIIDLQNAVGCEILLSSGSLVDADATFAVTIDEGNASNLSGSNAVAAADLIGSLPAITFADDNAVWKFGYKGTKRYIRITITPTGNASAATFSAAALIEKRKA